MGSRLWEDRRAAKLVVKYLFLPVLAAGIVGGAMIGLPPRARTVEADDPMPVKPPQIDGKRAYKYLEQICKIGPRTAGSAANTRQREMVAEHFKKMGAKVTEQALPSG